MRVEIEKAAFAATWRDESTGEIVGYTLGDTMCQTPRRPWALTITRDDDQLIAPCGECPGCLEFLRRRLADRLTKKYSSGRSASRVRIRDIVLPTDRKYGKRTSARTADTSSASAPGPATAGATSSALWLIRIWYPAELQVELSRKLHRRKGLELEPGFYRLGMTSFAVLARSKLPLPRVLRRLGLRHHVEPIRLSRGRRAWRRLTSGLLIARAVYGKEVKRWYARGLPPAERLNWDVVKKAMQKPWRRRTGARVRTGSKIILVPPAIWSMHGDRMNEYRKTAATASSPEEVEVNKRWLLDLVAGVAKHSNLEASAQPTPKHLVSREFYSEMAKRKRADASATPVAALTPSTLLGRGLRSSVHSESADEAAAGALDLETWLHSGAPPPQMGRERDYEDWLEECWSDGRTRRAILEERRRLAHAQIKDRSHEKFLGELDCWLERMKSKIRGG